VYSFVKGLGTYDMRTIENSLPHPLKIFGSKNV